MGHVNFTQKIALVLKKSGFYLFPITFLGIFLDQWLTATLEAELMSPQGASNWIWAAGAASILLNLLYPLLAMVVILAALSGQSVGSFIAQNFCQSIKEQMRTWGQTLWWSLLLIIPGVIKFIQYSLVTFVVCLMPEYRQGQVDALKTSQKLVAKIWGRLVTVLLIFSVILPLILSSVQEYRLFMVHPVSAVLFAALDVILNVVGISLVFVLFTRSLHESHVSVERS